MYNFCSASECGATAPVSTMVISGDERGPFSSEDVLFDEILWFQLVNSNLEIVICNYIWIQEKGLSRKRTREEEN